MDLVQIFILILGVGFTIHGFLLIFSKKYYEKIQASLWKENDPSKKMSTGDKIYDKILGVRFLMGGIFLILLFFFFINSGA